MQCIVIETQSQLSPKVLPTETNSTSMAGGEERENNIREALLSELVDHLVNGQDHLK